MSLKQTQFAVLLQVENKPRFAVSCYEPKTNQGLLFHAMSQNKPRFAVSYAPQNKPRFAVSTMSPKQT